MEKYLFTKEKVFNILNTKTFATIITYGKNGIGSRTMLFAISGNKKLFLLTLKTSAKIEEIMTNKSGIVHLGYLEEDFLNSFDIQIKGDFEILDVNTENYQIGVQSLGAKEPQILEMLKTDMKDLYLVLQFNIKQIKANSYFMGVNNIPNFIINE